MSDKEFEGWLASEGHLGLLARYDPELKGRMWKVWQAAERHFKQDPRLSEDLLTGLKGLLEAHGAFIYSSGYIAIKKHAERNPTVFERGYLSANDINPCDPQP